MRQRPIELTIEHLVLPGANPADRDHLIAAIETELSRLVTAEGLPHAYANGGMLNRLNAGPVSVQNGASVETTARARGRRTA